MKKLVFIMTLVCYLMPDNDLCAQNEGAPSEIVKYYFVELITNPDRPELPKAQVDSIQGAHMANIGRMAQEGTLMLAGPFENGGGIFILKVESMAAAEKLVARDPAVQAGRLLTEIRPWYTAKGMFAIELKDDTP
ncbi:MAG: YciI family protein [Bacteroidota bacterium]